MYGVSNPNRFPEARSQRPGAFSRRSTLPPRRAMENAVDAPAKPPPITITSGLLMRVGYHGCRAVKNTPRYERNNRRLRGNRGMGSLIVRQSDFVEENSCQTPLSQCF